MIPRVEFRFNVIRYHPDDVTRYILANKDRGEVNRYGESEMADFTSKLRLAMGTQLEAGQQLLTVSEAARLLGVGLSRMRALGDQGVVPWVRLRPLDSVRFDLADVQEAIERRRGPVRRTALPGGES
jgi:excisionase family DNA binding protein